MMELPKPSTTANSVNPAQTSTDPGVASSSESGFSDSLNTEEEMSEVDNNSTDSPQPVKRGAFLPPASIPERTPSEEKEAEPNESPPEVAEVPSPSATTGEPVTTVTVFIPPLDYLTSIPDELMPSLIRPPAPVPKDQEGIDGGAEADDAKTDDVDYGSIYNRLLESTQRTLELASRYGNYFLLCSNDCNE